MLKLEPKEIWRFFEEISEIPRCSGNEDRIREYVLEVAADNGLRSQVDEAGNVLLSDTREGESPGVVLQAHLDMVCEKNSSVEHDFSSDPIELTEEDGWVTAEGTTLGADNGIGVAIALAVATGDYEVGPLDYLFTVDEERGLNGAKNLDPGFLRGDKLINLDSEDFGAFTIGCAGGGKTEIDLPIEWVDDPDGRLVEVSVCGLAGGHSGEDIDRGRANANKLLGRMLDGVGKDLDFRLAEISGGDKHNAIPREASALLSYEGKVGELRSKLREAFVVFREEYAETEPEMELGVEEQPGAESDRVMTVEAGRTALDLLLALPHGVMAYDQRFESTVETSTNLASIRTERERIKVLVSSRSSRGSKLENLRRRIELIAGSFGAQVNQNEAYPAWQPIRDSELLTRAVEVFRDLRGRDPEVRTIHGGLETGIIGKKVEGLEMIALGPNIEFPHSPDERMEVESVRKFWDFLLELLGSLA